MLLKPLAAAEADGDRILGVIKGARSTPGGKTSGYTVPNPHAQAELVAQAATATPAWTRARSATSRRTARAPRWATPSRSAA